MHMFIEQENVVLAVALAIFVRALLSVDKCDVIFNEKYNENLNRIFFVFAGLCTV